MPSAKQAQNKRKKLKKLVLTQWDLLRLAIPMIWVIVGPVAFMKQIVIEYEGGFLDKLSVLFAMALIAMTFAGVMFFIKNFRVVYIGKK